MSAYNVDQRNVYVTTGTVNPNMYHHPSPTVPSSNPYTNGHPNKKRRHTLSSSKGLAHAVPPPLLTPTSATHPSNSTGKSTATESASKRASSPATSLPSFSPPPPQSSTTGNMANNSTNNLQLPFSPNFAFSPLPPIPSLAPSLAPTPTPGLTQAHPPPPQSQDQSHAAFDPMLSMPTPYDQQPTPGAASTSGGSVHTDPDKDPFLSLLEQLAENEVSRGGPSELDYFLGGQSG